MRILAALRARTMAGTASTPSVAKARRRSWGRRAAGGGGGSGCDCWRRCGLAGWQARPAPPAWRRRGAAVGGGGRRLWTGRRRRAWVFLWGVAKSCGSGGLARRQISAPAAVSGDVLRGLQRVAFTDEAGGPTAIGQFHLAQTQRRRDQR